MGGNGGTNDATIDSIDGDTITVTWADHDPNHREVPSKDVTKDGVSCQALAEDKCASSDLNDCDVNADCTNDAGSFSCACKPGYEGDGKTCMDMNECAISLLNDCDVNADCTNEIGGFSCACKPGYEGDGKTCMDMNECAISQLNDCDVNA